MCPRVVCRCGDPLLHAASLSQPRHRHHLTTCSRHVTLTLTYLSLDVVLAAEQLRVATRELALITGAVSTEDILDTIFTHFCIGK